METATMATHDTTTIRIVGIVSKPQSFTDAMTRAIWCGGIYDPVAQTWDIPTNHSLAQMYLPLAARIGWEIVVAAPVTQAVMVHHAGPEGVAAAYRVLYQEEQSPHRAAA
jgi:hypothetical protein